MRHTHKFVIIIYIFLKQLNVDLIGKTLQQYATKFNFENKFSIPNILITMIKDLSFSVTVNIIYSN